MLTRLLLVFCALTAAASLELAQADVNKGDLAALTNIKGDRPWESQAHCRRAQQRRQFQELGRF